MAALTVGEWVAVLVTAAFAIIGLTALGNLLFFPRLRPGRVRSKPFVSILIPARDEAAVIGDTVRALLRQSYTNFELILLDDQSGDGTGAIAAAAAGDDDRFRLANGRSLPPGWLGKNWACYQLAQHARSDYLLFADADVRWQPDALAALLAASQADQTDLLTVWPTQLTHTWAERLVVPNIALAVLAYLPVTAVHHTSWPAFAAANGQCLLFRRAAYAAVGGHEAVRDNVVEDVALARRIKARGLRLRMADGNRLISCRMYPDWPAVRDGFAKNILAGHGNSVPFLAASAVFHWLLFIWPWGWWLAGGGWWALGLGAAGIAIRAGTAAFTHQRARDALLTPLSVLLMTRIAAQSVYWRWRGSGEWKGRKIEISDWGLETGDLNAEKEGELKNSPRSPISSLQSPLPAPHNKKNE